MQIDSGTMTLRPPKQRQEQLTEQVSRDPEEDLEVIPFEEPQVDPSKTGNKPKKLVAVEVYGYEVGRGRNKRIVFPKDVYELAAIGCNDREIARWFDVNEDTLRYNFADIIEKGRADLKHSLRRAQIKVALSGNPTMLIWLGRNMLNQTETPESADQNRALPWTDDE